MPQGGYILDSDKIISFNDAWKEFLIIRAIPYKLGVGFYWNSEHRVTNVVIKSLPERQLKGHRYFCDDSMEITLSYPRNVVLTEFENKLVKPYLGRRLEKWERKALKGKLKHSQQEIHARLGRFIKSEIEKLITEEGYWEALFSIHPILEHRLRKIAKYKSMKVDKPNSRILVNKNKEELWESKMRMTFKRLMKLAFLNGAIDEETWKRITRFDRERDKIAHKLLKERVQPHMLKSLCQRGLKLMDALETCFSSIVPKPKFIIMGKFEVKSLKENT